MEGTNFMRCMGYGIRHQVRTREILRKLYQVSGVEETARESRVPRVSSIRSIMEDRSHLS